MSPEVNNIAQLFHHPWVSFLHLWLDCNSGFCSSKCLCLRVALYPSPASSRTFHQTPSNPRQREFALTPCLFYLMSHFVRLSCTLSARTPVWLRSCSCELGVDYVRVLMPVIDADPHLFPSLVSKP
jgi:hypothetical protein